MNKLSEPIVGGHIEFNQDFAHSYDLLENTSRNIFITGKAGTGKSTLLQYFRAHTAKNVAVLAPTGVAAVNIKGQTIHSFFRFKPDITTDSIRSIRIRKTQKKLYQSLNTVVIDEVSMMRADLLDCIDLFLRLYGPKKMVPFGGVQMVFIGDLFQLPPVVTRRDQELFKDIYASPYFFDSNIFKELNGEDQHPQRFEMIELKKIYRQNEEEFIRLLGVVRDRTATADHIKQLNTRYIPHFCPRQDEFFIYLTTTNTIADQINNERLETLDGEGFRYEGKLTGDFNARNLPTQQVLRLKTGAQVMLLNNDPQGRWINGSIGKIIEFIDNGKLIMVELADGSIADVSPFQWDMFRFFYNEDTASVESEATGSFLQYPIRLAWAVTIHKSQGKTFSKVIIDVGRGTFAHGQVYVALSRCTSFEGIVLKKPLLKSHILIDHEVVNFMASHWSDTVNN